MGDFWGRGRRRRAVFSGWVGIGVWLLLGGAPASAESTPNVAAVPPEKTITITCIFGENPARPEVKACVKGDATYVNLPFFNLYLHTVSQWDPESGSINLQLGKLDLHLRVGETQYLEHQTAYRLAAAPFEQDGEVWLPLECVQRLGVVIKQTGTGTIRLDWAEPYLLGIESVTYQERPAFLLIGSRTLTVKSSSLLQNPERLMIDLSGVRLHPAFAGFTPGPAEDRAAEPLIKSVRVSERDPDIVRLVFDLSALTGYRLIRNPEAPEQLMVVCNALITGFRFSHQDAVRKLTITTSQPTQFRVFNLSGPRRMVIDFEGATLDASVTKIAGDGQWLGAARLAQFDPYTVRAVLDLKDETPCYVTRSPADPNRIEVRTVQAIQGITLGPDGNSITISGDSELAETIRRLHNPERLEIDLNYFRFSKGLTLPKLYGPFIQGLRMIEVSPIQTRLELEISKYLLYEAEFSADRTRMTLRFKQSFFCGKTVVLDAGHGGVDPGTCGSQGTLEKEFTLDVAMRLKDLLEEAGSQVVLTRHNDQYVGLFERPRMANYFQADLFISIHCNSFSQDRRVRGIEIYYQQKNAAGKRLAERVLEQVTARTGLNSRGVKANDYVVLVETVMPGILAELGYLSNYEEETRLRSSGFRDNAALGIFEGMALYFEDQSKQDGAKS